MRTEITARSSAAVGQVRPAVVKPSLPACAMSRLGSLGGSLNAPTLPKDLMLTGRDQQAVRAAISSYRSALLESVPARNDAAAERMGAVLGGMFLAWPMFGASREQIAALTVRYLGAVAEMPVWAVQGAVDRWRDGKWKLEFGESFDKIPSSATLRKIAEYIFSAANAELNCLERMDAAVALIPPAEVSPEERARIGEKLKALSAEMGERLAARTNDERASNAR